MLAGFDPKQKVLLVEVSGRSRTEERPISKKHRKYLTTAIMCATSNSASAER